MVFQSWLEPWSMFPGFELHWIPFISVVKLSTSWQLLYLSTVCCDDLLYYLSGTAAVIASHTQFFLPASSYSQTCSAFRGEGLHTEVLWKPPVLVPWLDPVALPAFCFNSPVCRFPGSLNPCANTSYLLQGTIKMSQIRNSGSSWVCLKCSRIHDLNVQLHSFLMQLWNYCCFLWAWSLCCKGLCCREAEPQPLMHDLQLGFLWSTVLEKSRKAQE